RRWVVPKAMSALGHKRTFSQCLLCAMCGRLPVGKGFLDVLPFGRCGHVCGRLMRHTKAAGHNAFRGDGSRPKARARSAMAQMGFPALGFDRSVHYIASALPKLFAAVPT